MNKKQIVDIMEEYINVIIETPLYSSRAINSTDVEFITESLMKIKGKLSDPDTFIQTKDIKIIRGVGKL